MPLWSDGWHPMLTEEREHLTVQDTQEVVGREGLGIGPHNDHGAVAEETLSRIDGEVVSEADLACDQFRRASRTGLRRRDILPARRRGRDVLEDVGLIVTK